MCTHTLIYTTSSWSFIIAKSGLPLIRVNESEVYLDNATIDGERVMFICSNDVQHSFEQAHTAVCNPQGLNWQPNTANVYSGMCIVMIINPTACTVKFVT